MSSPPLTEIRRDILSSTAFKLSLRFAVIFVICLLVLDLAIGLGARWVAKQNAEAAVEEKIDDLRAAFNRGGGVELAVLIAELAEELHEDGLIVGHQSPDGVLLAGGLAIPRPEFGWSIYLPEGVDVDEALWTKAVRLPGGTWITAGANSETYHDIGEFMIACAFWTIAIAFPMALLSGVLLSRTILGRLARITETAEAVRTGELSRRAPLMGTRDEFDRLAENLNAMLDTMETLTRNLRNVSVGIAHELRTPLARIRNRLVQIKDGATTSDDGLPVIDGAMAEIDGALTTFDALLRIGQIEADAQQRGFETVHFSDLVTELAEVYDPVAVEQGKSLSIKITQGVDLRGNRALLAQMISNLLENAIQHTPAGTSITIELSASENDRKLVVHDDGPGIPATETERIFDRFYQVEKGRADPGNGFGLSLVRSICSLHGFTVQLRPDAPGTTFEVAL